MAISVEHFSRTYGDLTAVDDLSFELASGEIVGLIGPNGAGKTTTLRSLAGILRPTTGTLRIDGHDIVTDGLEAKRRLAFMPDEPHPFEYLTVEEHLRDGGVAARGEVRARRGERGLVEDRDVEELAHHAFVHGALAAQLGEARIRIAHEPGAG